MKLQRLKTYKMRIVVLSWVALFVSVEAIGQEKITARYLKSKFEVVKNNGFVTRKLLFLKDHDTLRVNVRLPFDINNARINNPGIYYNCHLKEDTLYTITLKKICVNDIPSEHNSYYRTNCIPDEADCSKFKEVDKDTEYRYIGNYGKYIDIDNVLYEIENLSPDNGCFYPH